MKILKTMTAAALLVMGTAVMAQNQGNRQMRSTSERAKTETETIAKAVVLNAEQTAKIQTISLKYAVKDSVRSAEMRKAREEGATIDREDMTKKMTADRDAKTAEFKTVLTTEQQAKYAEYIKANPPRGFGGQGGQGRQGGQGGNQGDQGGNQGGQGGFPGGN